MPSVQANGVRLEYDSFGDGEPLVLVMGIGAQMILWQEDFCQRLADRGFRVIRFDNRDVGLSTWLDHIPPPSMTRVLLRAILGLRIDAPYTLDDMANDAVGLLDALGLERAHIVGASMGGMIAQTMALNSPQRVASLTSIMSHPGDRVFWISRPKAIKALLCRVPRDREAFAENAVSFFRVVGGPGFPFDEDGIRERARLGFDRAFHPDGFKRHFAAVAAAKGRYRRLRSLRVPTLVIHGSHDPLIVPTGGRATAQAIPGAKLLLVKGMGHGLPEGAWPIIIPAIADHAQA